MARHDLTYDRLFPWADQPRRCFDDDAIDRLAASIAANGILQNLVARHPVEFRGLASDQLWDVEVIAGGSRLRAIGLLVEREATIAGTPAAAYPIPVEVLFGLSDADALELATVENVQRQELSPLEEADALARLVDLGRGTDALADKIGMTRRYVQMQVKLARYLAPEAREALAAGTVTLAAARELCRVPAEAQLEALPQLRRGTWGWQTAAQIRDSLVSPMLPAEAALFDLAAYDGAIVEDEAEDAAAPRRWLADRDKVRALQCAAVAAMAERLEADGTWSRVHVHHTESRWDNTRLPWRGFASGDGVDEAVIVLNLATLAHELHGNCRPVADEDAEEEAEDDGDDGNTYEAERAAARGGFSHPHVGEIATRRNAAVAAAMLRDARVAKASLLACLAGHGPVDGCEIYGGDERDQLAPGMAAARDALCAALDAAAGQELPWDDADPFWVDAPHGSQSAAALLAAALAFDDDALDRALAVAMALRVECRAESFGALGLGGQSAVLVDALDAGAELAAGFRLDKAWLDTLDAGQLVALAEDIGAPNADEATLLGHPLPAGWLPPELAFGTQAEILARLADRPAWRAACAEAGERRSSRLASSLTERQGRILQAIAALYVAGEEASIARIQAHTGDAHGAVSQERKALRDLALLDADNAPTDLGMAVAGHVVSRPAEAAE